MTLVEDTKTEVFARLQNRPAEQFGAFTSPRWLNKQLKFLLSTLHETAFENVLKKTEEGFGKSHKTKLWAPVFASILTLAMAVESLQLTVLCKNDTDIGEGKVERDDSRAREQIEMMDKKFRFLDCLFRKAYKPDYLGSPAHRTKLDEPSQALALKVAAIINRERESNK